MQFTDLDISKNYTYADYLKWDFKERVELLLGKVFKMSPAPNSRHQILSIEISGLLWHFLKRKKCRVFSAPFDVRLPHKNTLDEEIITVLQPDICVICDTQKIDKRGCLGAPDIVVEILSPNNNVLELNNKFDIYESAGVKEYWVVSPQDNTFLVNTLVNGKYSSSGPYVAGQKITTPILIGFSIDLEELFVVG